MEKRTVADKNEARNLAFDALANLEVEGHKNLGRCKEGWTFENIETGFCVVIRPIAKNEDFEGEFEVTDFEDEQAKKKLDAEAKKAKTAKAKAKREAEKAKEKEEKGEQPFSFYATCEIFNNRARRIFRLLTLFVHRLLTCFYLNCMI